MAELNMSGDESWHSAKTTIDADSNSVQDNADIEKAISNEKQKKKKRNRSFRRFLDRCLFTNQVIQILLGIFRVSETCEAILNLLCTCC